MAKLPTVTSDIPRDLRNYLDRVREALNATGADELLTVRRLTAIGLLERAADGTVLPANTEEQYQTPPAPLNLQANGALANITLSWDQPVYLGHAHTEIWAAGEPDGGGVPALGDAVLVGMSPGTVFAHNIGSAATRWYWVRFVNIAGQEGPYNAVDGLEATTGQDSAYLLELLQGQITESELFGSLGDRIDLIDGPETLAGSVAAQIASESTTRASEDAALAQNITTLAATVNGNTAAVQQEANVRASETGALFGQYTVKIDLNGYVSGYGLASTANDGAPTSEFVVRADSFSVGTPGGTTPAPEVPFVVRTTPTTIGGEPVPAGVYLRDGFIQNGTITNAKIGDAAIDTAKIADAAIVSAKIGNAEVATANIADAAITSAKIQNAAITTAKIADAQITNAKIADLDAGKITAGFISADRIQAESIDASKIDSRGLSIKDTLGNTILSAGTSLSTDYIAGLGSLATANSVDYSAVTGTKPPSDADRTASNIAAGISGQGNFATLDQITSANVSTYIASAAIRSAQIGNAQITNAKIASLDAGKITTGTLSASRINVDDVTLSASGGALFVKDSAIGTFKIVPSAVTAGGASGGTAISFTGFSGATVIAWATAGNTQNGPITVSLRLNSTTIASAQVAGRGSFDSPVPYVTFFGRGTASGGTNTVSISNSTFSNIALAFIQLKR